MAGYVGAAPTNLSFGDSDVPWYIAYKLVPRVGLEPTTLGLKDRYSTNWVIGAMLKIS